MTMLAIDIGGTKALAALVDGERVLERRTIPTPRGFDAGWIDAIAALAEGWEGRYEAATAAVTGVIRDGAWTAINPAILPVPGAYPLADLLSDRLRVPVQAVNDAQAAAWGEYLHGSGQGRDMVFLTISSGIGGGIVTDGRLWRGARGLAGSLGQLPALVGGESVRMESRASGFGMAAAARATGRDLDARAIFAAAGEGWADAILDTATTELATALAGLQAVVDPEIVIIGGGVGLAPGFLDRVRRALAPFPERLRPELVPAALGGDAGIIGAGNL